MIVQTQLKVGYIPSEFGQNFEEKAGKIIARINKNNFNYPIEISLFDQKQNYDKIILPFYDDWSKGSSVKLIFEGKRINIENSFVFSDINDIRKNDRFLICNEEYHNYPKEVVLQETNKLIKNFYKVNISIFGLDNVNDAHIVLSAVNYNNVSIHNFFIYQYCCGDVHKALWLETMFDESSDNLSVALKYLKNKEKNIKIRECGTCWPF